MIIPSPSTESTLAITPSPFGGPGVLRVNPKKSAPPIPIINITAITINTVGLLLLAERSLGGGE